MSIFKNNNTHKGNIACLISSVSQDSKITSYGEIDPAMIVAPKEEWIWVEGYKGTDKDMKCRDFQYVMNTQFDMPEDMLIKKCHSGFHLCLHLSDVFDFYNIGDGNRFFKVKALVRKSDYENYNNDNYITLNINAFSMYNYAPNKNRKLASKSIIFTEEVSADEILKGTAAETLSDKYKTIAIERNVEAAVIEHQAEVLIEDGYSVPFAHYICSVNKFNTAHAVGSQKDLSMDMKVLIILKM